MNETYFAPPWPLVASEENSMWMRATSGGSTTAPGPFLMESSWRMVNGRVFGRRRRSCEGLPSMRLLVCLCLRKSMVHEGLTVCSFLVRLNTFTILNERAVARGIDEVRILTWW